MSETQDSPEDPKTAAPSSEPNPAAEAAEGGSEAGSGAEADAPRPYGNLLVPLVVVPAIIVMVLVLVFVLFAGVVGEESTPRENLQTMLEGGKNARQQAAFNLVRQTLEAWQAERDGTESAWDLDETFVPSLETAWERVEEDEVATRLVLSILLAGEGQGVEKLTDLLAMPEKVDPGAEFRFKAVGALGLLGERVEGPERQRAAQALIGLLEHPDEGLQGAAVASRQAFPGAETTAALQEMLRSSSLVLRGNAALSLAELGDPSGAGVLLEMLEPDSYGADRAADGRKWSSERLVSESRQRALATLVELDQLPERSVLERFTEDPDLDFRGIVHGLLADAE